MDPFHVVRLAGDAAYRQPDRAKGRGLMVTLIDSISHGVPAALAEIVTLGRTLSKRADDVLAYFDRPGTSNGPTEAINGRSNTSAAPPSDSAT
jgi:transposase